MIYKATTFIVLVLGLVFLISGQAQAQDLGDLQVLGCCVADTGGGKPCVDTVYVGQPWHIRFAVVNNSPFCFPQIWSFNISVKNQQTGEERIIKSQIDRTDPLPQGQPLDINWEPTEVFADTDKGGWELTVRVTSKDQQCPDVNPDDNVCLRKFLVVNKPCPQSSISGMKYEDLDGDGIKDPGEPGLGGWKIVATDAAGVEYSATTDASGNYQFKPLPPGTYRVEEVLQPGYSPTGEPYYTITLDCGQDVTGIDFGNYKPGAIYGMKWNDLNNNGVKDPGEPGIPGWTICLEQKAPPPSQTWPTTGGLDFLGNTFANIVISPWAALPDTQIDINLCAKGPTVVNRGNPSGGNAGDSANTEITLLEMVGTLPPPFPNDTFIIRHKADRRSFGTIQLTSVDPFSFIANSFFDVFFELQLPPSLGAKTLVNKDPLRMETTINTIPPGGSNYFGFNTLLVDKNNPTDTQFVIKFVNHCVTGQGGAARCDFNCPKAPDPDPPPAGGGFQICVQTDANGNYCFMNLPPVVYNLYEEQRSGWNPTTNPGPISINVTSGSTLTGVDFGNEDKEPPVITPTWTWTGTTYASGPFTAMAMVNDNSIPEGMPADPMMLSFFDVFFDISTDGGATYMSQMMEKASFFDVFTELGAAGTLTGGHFHVSSFFDVFTELAPQTQVMGRIRAMDGSGNVSIVSLGTLIVIPTPPIVKPIFPAPLKKQRDFESGWYGKGSNSWCGPTAASACLQRLNIPGLPQDKRQLVEDLARQMNCDNIAKDGQKGTGNQGGGTLFWQSATRNGFVEGINKYLTNIGQRANYTIKVYHPNTVDFPNFKGHDEIIARYPTYDDYSNELHAGEDVLIRIRYGPKDKNQQNGGHWVTGMGQVDNPFGGGGTIVVMDPATGDTGYIDWSGNQAQYAGTTVTIKSMVAISPIAGTGRICVNKYYDENHNNELDPNEGPPPTTVPFCFNLFNSAGALVDEQCTSPNGIACFENVPPGSYTITEKASPGYVSSDPKSGELPIEVRPGEPIKIYWGNAAALTDQYFRTATMRQWALDVDQKGKFKAIKCKPHLVDFKLNLRVPQVAGAVVSVLQLKFSMPVDTLRIWEGHKIKQVPLCVDRVSTDAKKQLWTIDLNCNGQVPSPGAPFQIDGRGLKGKLIKVGYVWLTKPPPGDDVVKGTLPGKPIPGTGDTLKQDLRVPKPNLHNVGEAIYGGVRQTTVNIVVGIPSKDPTGAGAHTVAHPKYKDVQKTLNKKGDVHSKLRRCIDVFDKNQKPILKQVKSLPLDKHNNLLLAEQLALKLNVAASDSGCFPPGLGDLIYDNSKEKPECATDPCPFNGKTIRAIIAQIDSFLTCNVIPKSPQADSEDVKKVLQQLNDAFDGPVDTIRWSCGKPVLTGVFQLKDIPYLRANPGAISPVIAPSEPVPMYNTPDGFELGQNYPNPFNPTTTIEFELPEPAIVTLKIYNTLGQEVAILLDHEELDEGYEEVEFDASSLTSGVYFYRITAEVLGEDDEGETITTGQTYVSVKKMLLLK